MPSYCFLMRYKFNDINDSQHRWLQARESSFDNSYEDKNVINIANVFDLEYMLSRRRLLIWNVIQFKPGKQVFHHKALAFDIDVSGNSYCKISFPFILSSRFLYA